ncbi:flagellar export chaperone FlgN [Lignipirellula cremea]|uniref:FlgN protein n=1 Tax=Lignipirellula cremea TaxID=2528010 RepID=A0A518DQ58_9BACT|nr:flagellar export chaperone FlgN [Lignipirellula cremea]QDU93970.1 FlgN protein [Lignipirellula cremea]
MMDTDRLAELIDAKREVLTRLRQFARRQVEVVAEEDLTRLFSLLAAKQTLVDELTRLETELNPFRNQQPEDRVWRSPEARDACRESVQSCEAIYRELLLLEKQGAADLSERRDHIARQLDGAHSAAKARRAYGHEAATRPAVSAFDCTSD